MLLDPGSGCASPLSIDGIAFGVVTWSTSRFSMVQVGQMVLDHYTAVPELSLLDTPAPIVQANKLVEVLVVVAAICDI